MRLTACGVSQGAQHRAALPHRLLLQGLARGAYLGRTGVVTDSMLMVAAETLPGLIDEQDVAAGLVYPRLKVGRAGHNSFRCPLL